MIPSANASANTPSVAIAVISAPRPQRTVERTLAELRRAGFSQTIHVMQEPGTDVEPAPGVLVHTNATRLGLWPNWRNAAHHLLQCTEDPYLLICEDDLKLCPGAAAVLQRACETLDHDQWGYASLYTSQNNLAGRVMRVGWQELPAGPRLWGALAYCFTRESLKAILHSRTVRRQTRNDGTDLIVPLAVQELGRQCYFHVPSVCSHAGGGISSVGHSSHPWHLAIGFSPTYDGRIPRSGPVASPANVENAAIAPPRVRAFPAKADQTTYMLTGPSAQPGIHWRIQSVYGEFALAGLTELVPVNQEPFDGRRAWRSTPLTNFYGDWRLQTASTTTGAAQLALCGAGGVTFDEPIRWEAKSWEASRPNCFLPDYGDLSLALTVRPLS